MNLKSSMHRIQIRNREESKDLTTTGANCQVFLDDVPLKGVSFLKFEVKAGKVAKVTMEMYAIADLDMNTYLEKTKVKTTVLTVNDDPVNIYTLSSYYPSFIAVKNKS